MLLSQFLSALPLQEVWSGIISIPVYIFWFIVVMIPLVTIHEFGHFIMAKIFKVRVPEFGVGVPPRAYAKRWKGMLWSLNWLPLGAFVRISGDSDSYENVHLSLKSGTESQESIKQKFVKDRVEELYTLNDIDQYVVDNSSFIPTFAKGEKVEEIITCLNNHHKKLNDKTYLDSIEYTESDKFLQNLAGCEFDEYFVNNKAKQNIFFYSKNLLQKIIILIGGVAFNVLMACFLLFVALNTTGLNVNNSFDSNPIYNPSLIDYKSIIKGSKDQRELLLSSQNQYPLSKLGLDGKFELVSIDSIGAKDLTNASFREYIKSKDTGYVFNFVIIVDGVVRSYPVIQQADKILGTILTNNITYKSQNLVSSISDSIGLTGFYTERTATLTVEALQGLFSKDAKIRDKSVEGTAGPVAIAKISGRAFESGGVGSILWLMALISLSLAFMNILPIPALDGGRIVLTILYHIFGARVKKIEPYLVGSTYALLLGLMVLVLFKDLINFNKL